MDKEAFIGMFSIRDKKLAASMPVQNESGLWQAWIMPDGGYMAQALDRDRRPWGNAYFLEKEDFHSLLSPVYPSFARRSSPQAAQVRSDAPELLNQWYAQSVGSTSGGEPEQPEPAPSPSATLAPASPVNAAAAPRPKPSAPAIEPPVRTRTEQSSPAKTPMPQKSAPASTSGKTVFGKAAPNSLTSPPTGMVQASPPKAEAPRPAKNAAPQWLPDPEEKKADAAGTVVKTSQPRPKSPASREESAKPKNPPSKGPRLSGGFLSNPTPFYPSKKAESSEAAKAAPPRTASPKTVAPRPDVTRPNTAVAAETSGSAIRSEAAVTVADKALTANPGPDKERKLVQAIPTPEQPKPGPFSQPRLVLRSDSEPKSASAATPPGPQASPASPNTTSPERPPTVSPNLSAPVRTQDASPSPAITKTVRPPQIAASTPATGVEIQQRTRLVPERTAAPASGKQTTTRTAPEPARKTVAEVAESSKVQSGADPLACEMDMRGDFETLIRLAGGNVNIRLGKELDDEIEKLLLREAPLSSKQKYMYSEFGLALRKIGKHTLALLAHQRALLLSPDDENILFNIARAEYELGMVEEAKNSLRKALSKAPGFAPAWKFFQFLNG